MIFKTDTSLGLNQSICLSCHLCEAEREYFNDDTEYITVPECSIDVNELVNCEYVVECSEFTRDKSQPN